jgi:hypothetical protein
MDAKGICVVVDYPGETAEQFETVMTHLGTTGPVPPAGVRLFVSGPADGGWRSISVWDSPESISTFLEERLAPAYQEAGLSLENARQSRFDVHTVVTRG